MIDPIQMSASQSGLAKLFILAGTPVCGALLSGGLITAYGCYDRFGFDRTDPIAFPIVLLLALSFVSIALWAWFRFVILRLGSSRAPIVTRLVPFLVIGGLGFGVWAGLDINRTRDASYARSARSACTKVLCPELSSSYDDECAEKHTDFPVCEAEALVCFKESRPLDSRKRDEAELSCIRARLDHG